MNDPLHRFERVRRWLVLASLALAVGGAFWLRAEIGFITVPAGMDTLLATHPPGAACLVAKRPARVHVRDAAFVDLPDGGSLLLRVTEVRADGSFLAQAEHAGSRFYATRFAPFAAGAARARVLSVFGAKGDPDARR